MSEDLPIYSEAPLRTGLQFAAIDRLKGRDTTPVWSPADQRIASLEDASGATSARTNLKAVSKEELLALHSRLFPGREGAGRLRAGEMTPIYRGQDCAPPEFIERSLDNLMVWLNAESFSQIHPIERCALTMMRIVDVWPFEFGNLTAAVVFANLELQTSGFTPFSVGTERRAELEKAIAQAMTIDMQPLINAICQTVKKEMESLGG